MASFVWLQGHSMGNRLSQIATRTGDDGTTGLADGTRVSKDHLRVAAMGDVDELNSNIGVLLTGELSDSIRSDLAAIQNDLFDLGGELAIPGYSMISDKQVARLDARLAHYNADLPRLAEFISARRFACGRSLRTCAVRCAGALSARWWRWASRTTINDGPRQYLNRLSDLLFVLARVLNREAGGADVQWQQRKNQ